MIPALHDLSSRRMQWVNERRKTGAEGVYKAQALALPLPPSLHDALRVPRAERAIIAELRCAVRGNGRNGRDIAGSVKQVEALGASAISVGGGAEPDDATYQEMLAAAQFTALPILCRDLVVDPFQITMARAHGASAVVLTVGVIPERDLRAVFRHALELGLDVVVEVRSAHELEAASRLRAGSSESSSVRIVAVNATDTETQRTDRPLMERLVAAIPDHAVKVACTGCGGADEVDALDTMGYEAFVCESGATGFEPDSFRRLAARAR